MVQLEELVAVQGHDREAVAATDAELVPQRVRQAQHPVDVLGVGRPVRAVEEGDLVGVPLGRRQEMPVVHELLHASPRARPDPPRPGLRRRPPHPQWCNCVTTALPDRRVQMGVRFFPRRRPRPRRSAVSAVVVVLAALAGAFVRRMRHAATRWGATEAATRWGVTEAGARSGRPMASSIGRSSRGPMPSRSTDLLGRCGHGSCNSGKAGAGSTATTGSRTSSVAGCTAPTASCQSCRFR